MSANPVQILNDGFDDLIALGMIGTTDILGYTQSLFEPGDTVYTQVLNLADGKSDEPFVGTLTDLVAADLPAVFAKWQEAGWNVYVCMNPVDAIAKNRQKQNIAAIRNVYIEFDENGSEALTAIKASAAVGEIPQPHFILESSPGKFYVIWRVDGFTVGVQEGLNRALATKFGADMQSTDAARILRLPGTQNLKYAEKPVVTIIEQHLSPRYTPADFKIAFSAVEQAARVQVADEDIERKMEEVRGFLDWASDLIPRYDEKAAVGGGILALFRCPFPHKSGHHDGEAFAGVGTLDKTGNFRFECKHDSCKGIGWKEFRARVEKLKGFPYVFGASDVITPTDKVASAHQTIAQQTVSPSEDNYPEAMGEDAFYGVAGDFVRLVLPQTEADPAALLGNFLVAAGLLFSRNAWMVADGKQHFAVEYLLMAGDSGVGRKGTATNRVVPLMDDAQMFYRNRVLSGLSTGEGLVRALSPLSGESPDSVRWFLAVIQEFASLLSVMKREGNTMSAILREAFDGGHLRVMTRKDPLSVKNVNLAVIAHITPAELRSNLTDTDRVNGFANRFLTICVERSKLLPEGGEDINPAKIVAQLKDAIKKSEGRGRIQRDPAAKALWAKHYPSLTRKRIGLSGALSSRAETHVLRLSLIYALLDSADSIRVEHLKAALAFWKYVEASVEHIFGSASGDSGADKIIAALFEGPLTKTEISSLFGRNQTAEWVEARIQNLKAQGAIIQTTKETGKGLREAWGLKGRI